MAKRLSDEQRGAKKLPATSRAERRMQPAASRTRQRIGIKSTTDEFLVRGRLTHADGTPAVRFIVRAHDRDLRTTQLLGREATTDSQGYYKIRYSRKQF